MNRNILATFIAFFAYIGSMQALVVLSVAGPDTIIPGETFDLTYTISYDAETVNGFLATNLAIGDGVHFSITGYTNELNETFFTSALSETGTLDADRLVSDVGLSDLTPFPASPTLALTQTIVADAGTPLGAYTFDISTVLLATHWLATGSSSPLAFDEINEHSLTVVPEPSAAAVYFGIFTCIAILVGKQYRRYV